MSVTVYSVDYIKVRKTAEVIASAIEIMTSF